MKIELDATYRVTSYRVKYQGKKYFYEEWTTEDDHTPALANLIDNSGMTVFDNAFYEKVKKKVKEYKEKSKGTKNDSK